MCKEQNNQKQNKANFDCYLCNLTFIRVGVPCIHYNEEEDEGNEVSICDNCLEKVKQT